MLAIAMLKQRDAIRDSVLPPGAREPWTVKLSKPEALAWWKQNIDTPTGQEVLKRYDPLEQMSLRQALERSGAEEVLGGV